jgi:hypothetical protein
MSLGQTMISTAFFVLLTLAVLTANKMIIERSKSTLQLEAVEGATNLANSLLTEILTKKFDSQVTTDASGNITGPYTHDNYNSALKWPWPSTPTSFDAPSAMGTSSTTLDNVMPGGTPDSITTSKPNYGSVRGDNASWFDDMDDYCGDGTRPYIRAASSGSLTGYRLTVNVYYVKKATPNVSSSTQTFYKRIDVTVTNSLYLPKPLVFSAIATY